MDVLSHTLHDIRLIKDWLPRGNTSSRNLNNKGMKRFESINYKEKLNTVS